MRLAVARRRNYQAQVIHIFTQDLCRTVERGVDINQDLQAGTASCMASKVRTLARMTSSSLIGADA
jgi:hypothetical protein